MQDLTEHLHHCATAEQWKRIGIKKHHGINVPLFALHSTSSCGIGEFSDLIPLIHWCQSIGFDVIQLLPLNDTGWETSPYSALSAFALNPIHLGLAQLPYLENYPELKEQLAEFKPLNALQLIDYEQVRNKKIIWLRGYYAKAGKIISAQPAFQRFVDHNQWLPGYTLYKVLKRQYNFQSWESWPEQFRDITIPVYQQLINEYHEELSFHLFVQYLCQEQLKLVKAEAEKCGLFLKGDIPILIARDSADVWMNRELFRLDVSAGAPPDMYAREGQSWGFPLYDWDAAEKHAYAWWHERLQFAADYYHIFRIDHVVGFFRIWAVPQGKKATEGFFVPPDEAVWIDHGRRLMEMMIYSARMLPIGEDLGTVPPAVRNCLRDLGICGTRVVRWERQWHEAGQPFIKGSDYIPESMTTLSTHDSETVSQWWKNSPHEAETFCQARGWNYLPELTQELRLHILKESHSTASLFHINLLQEYLALFPELVWPNPEEERINIPGTTAHSNWRYRYRPCIEEIVEHTQLSDKMRELTQ